MDAACCEHPSLCRRTEDRRALDTLAGMERRIVPSHFNREGKPKRGYPSESVAREEAARLGMSFYRCDFCSRWHLASRPGPG